MLSAVATSLCQMHSSSAAALSGRDGLASAINRSDCEYAQPRAGSGSRPSYPPNPFKPSKPSCSPNYVCYSTPRNPQATPHQTQGLSLKDHGHAQRGIDRLASRLDDQYGSFNSSGAYTADRLLVLYERSRYEPLDGAAVHVGYLNKFAGGRRRRQLLGGRLRGRVVLCWCCAVLVHMRAEHQHTVPSLRGAKQ
jgi:hypothetical protein